MTRSTRSISILADTRRRTAAVAVTLAALALLGAVAAAGTATAQSEQPTVVVTDGTTTADGTTTVGVVLTSAPTGLSGYYLDLTVENPGVARIDSATYPDAFGLTTDPNVGSDGASITLEAADMEDAIEPGATDVTLATVTVTGATPGNVEIAVEPRQFDADDGSAFTPATQTGTVTVGGAGSESTADGSTNAAETDAAGDGTTDAGSDGGSDTERTDDSSSTESGTPQDTSGVGPLSPVLTLIAIGLLIAVGLRRRA